MMTGQTIAVQLRAPFMCRIFGSTDFL